MSAGSFIFISKLRQPTLKNILARPRLLDKAGAGGERKVITVTAGPGYGKTTLMAQMAEAFPGKTVWYQADSLDIDPVVFLRHLITGISEVHPQIGARSLERLTNVDDPFDEGKNVLGVLCDEVADSVDSPLNICLDDCHLIDRKYAARFLGYLARNLPEHVTLIMASRTKLPFSTTKLKSRGILRELSWKDLRFSSEEHRKLLGAWGIELTPRLVRELRENIDGWVTGLVLMETHLKEHATVPRLASNNRIRMNVYNFLAEEVLNTLEGEVQELLMKCALIDPIDAEVCGRSFGYRNTSKICRDAENMNIFVSRLSDRNTYRFHPLFRQFLLEKLENNHTREAIKGFRRTLAENLREEEKNHQAIDMFLSVGDKDSALELMEKIVGELVNDGEYSTLGKWLEHFDDNDLSPLVRMSKGQMLFASGKSEAALSHFSLALSGFSFEKDTDLYANCTLKMADCLRYLGRWKEAIDHLTSLSESITEPELKMQCEYELCLCYWSAYDDDSFHKEFTNLKNDYEKCGSIRNLFRLKIIEAANCCRTGDFSSAKKNLKTVLESKNISADQRNLYLNNLGSVYVVLGEYDEAEKVLKTNRRYVEAQRDDKCLPLMLDTIGCLKEALDIENGGERLFIKAIQVSEQQENHEDASTAYCHLGSSKRRSGKINEAIDLHSKSLGLAEKLKNVYRIAVNLVNIGADLLWLDEREKAISHLQRANRISEMNIFRYVNTQYDYQMAWLFHNEGDKDKEITHLRKALERAKKFQHNHFLIQEGKITLPLLLTALCEEITPGYVTWVLNKIGSKSLDIVEALINSDKIGLRLRAIDLMDNFKCESSLPLLRKASRDSDERVKEAAIRIARDIRKDLKKPDNILSQREIQVMELIATGITNKRIAEKLYISEVTVKTHLTNIFRKLGLSSRLEAGLYYQEFIKNNTFGVTDSYR